MNIHTIALTICNLAQSKELALKIPEHPVITSSKQELKALLEVVLQHNNQPLQENNPSL